MTVMSKRTGLQTKNTLSSRTERLAQGKALRRKTPREAHAELKGPLTRSAVAILAESDGDRVPELVPRHSDYDSLDVMG